MSTLIPQTSLHRLLLDILRIIPQAIINHIIIEYIKQYGIPKFYRSFGGCRDNGVQHYWQRRHGIEDGEFFFPRGICVNQNEIYVTDRRIQVFDKSSFKFLRKVSGYGDFKDFGEIYNICIDGVEMYVPDHIHHQIAVFDKVTFELLRKLKKDGISTSRQKLDIS